MAANQPPQWLTPDERELWIRLVRLAMLLPSTVDAQLKRDAGLSFFEYHVLTMLSEAEDRTRLMSDLARWSNSSLSRLSHVITRLEKQHWVRRKTCPNDRRATLAILTDAGFAHISAHAPAHVTEVRRLIFTQIEPELLPAISTALASILDHIQPDGAATLADAPHAAVTECATGVRAGMTQSADSVGGKHAQHGGMQVAVAGK